jgi:hypothetical protein
MTQLIEQLGHEDTEDRRDAADALVSIGEVSVLIESNHGMRANPGGLPGFAAPR